MRVIFLLIADVLLIVLSIVLSYGLRFDFDYANISNYLALVIPKFIFIAILSKIPIYYYFHLYNSLWKYAGINELFLIFSATFIGNLVLMAFCFFAQMSVPRSIFILVPLVDFIFLTTVRFSYRIIRRLRLGIGLRLKADEGKKVLIIGAGSAGAAMIKEIQLHPELGLLPVAAIDDDPLKKGMRLYNVPIIGGRELIPEVIKQYNIEETIIAIPTLGKKAFNEIYDLCSQTGCRVKSLPSVSQLIDGTVLIKQVRDINIEDLLGRDPIQLDVVEIAEFLENKVILITGAGGSIGSELARQIAIFAPKELILLDNYENSLFDINNELCDKYPELSIKAIVANIRDEQRILDIFKREKPYFVFHAAAHKHVPLMEENSGEAVKNNIFGTLNVAKAAIEAKVKRFVLISTDKAVNPTNIMGATKRVAEMIIQTLNKQGITEFVAVRFGNVLGSNGSVIPIFQKQIAEGGPVTVTHKEITRYFMLIPEAAQLVIQAGVMAKGGEIFVLDMGEPVRIYDLAKRIIRLSGFEPEEDIEIKITGLRPGEKLYEELLLDVEGLEATKNNKIYVLQPCGINEEELWEGIEALGKLVNGKSSQIRKQLQKLVPTFHKETEN